jgi:CO/xanthine dehydrogenase FAD-binding subunit
MSSYARPSDLDEALALSAQGYRVLAGGTDLYPSAGWGLAGDVLDISSVRALQGVSMGDGLRIGSSTTWSAIVETSLPPALHALQQAACQVGGRQVQNAGTIGGNICNASPAADGIPPLLALSAEVELAGLAGTRRMALEDCLIGPRKLALMPGEILVAVHIPAHALQGRSAFMKLGARHHLVISIAMVAVRLVVQDGLISHAATAVGACGPIARRLPDFEASLIGQASGKLEIDPDLIRRDLSPIDDIRASAQYRADVAVTLLRRLCEDLAR